jgi:ATP-dependent protease ClpP protease subunit/phage major head subunit gpT-like protein
MARKIFARGEWARLYGAGNTKPAELHIYGDIGESWWSEESVTAKSVVGALADIPEDDPLDVLINSYGGSVADGLAIYNALVRRKGPTSVTVDGVAVSIASLIAMAGDTVTMADNAMLMIHAPWGFASGNSVDMRDMADVLDRFADAMAGSYQRKSGQDHDSILQLLTDGEDHWYSASEAVDAGFADEITEAVQAAASFHTGRFRPPTTQTEGSTMPDLIHRQGEQAPENLDTKTDPEGSGIDENQIAAQARNDLIARNAGIRQVFSRFLDRDGYRAMMDVMLDDPNATIDQARATILDKLGEGAEPLAGNAAPVTPGDDEADKFQAAATTAILARAGKLSREERVGLKGNPFRGHKLLDVARACLDRSGVDTRGMDQRRIVAAAFTQSTSDFPILLEDAMHKAVQTAYATAADTWRLFCSVGSVSDFRAHKRYRFGSIGNLDSLNELGEFKSKTIPDGEKSEITADTKGNIITISRQAIIDDDLGAFVGLSSNLGRSAARTVEAAVYALVNLNSGLGPTMSDGDTLIHANHGNTVTGTGVTVAGIESMRVALASQMDVGSNDYLALQPSIWLGPIGHGGDARVVNDAQYDPDTANKLQKPNKVRGLFTDVVDTPRLSGNGFYMLADPADAPVFEVAFLDGDENPFLEMEEGFTVDGARYKVRLDFGVAALDYRGIVRNPGT